MKFLVLSLLVAQVVFAGFEAVAKDQTAKEFVLCKNHDEVRTLSVLINKNTDCVAHYSKKGVDEVIAQAKSPDICHNRLQQLQGTLKSANYNCRTVSKAQVTTSAEVSQQ